MRYVLLDSNITTSLASFPLPYSPSSESEPATRPDLDINVYERAISTSISASLDKFVSLRQISLSSKRKPWVTPQIKARMLARVVVYKRARATSSQMDVARDQERSVERARPSRKRANYKTI